jgi:hypothetical protein
MPQASSPTPQPLVSTPPTAPPPQPAAAPALDTSPPASAAPTVADGRSRTPVAIRKARAAEARAVAAAAEKVLLQQELLQLGAPDTAQYRQGSTGFLRDQVAKWREFAASAGVSTPSGASGVGASAPAPTRTPAAADSASDMDTELAPVVNTTAPKRPLLVDEFAMGDGIDWYVRRGMGRLAHAPQPGRGSAAKKRS